MTLLLNIILKTSSGISKEVTNEILKATQQDHAML